jgi:hypothetical protein
MGEDPNMARRFLAAVLVVALAPIDLAFAQSGGTAAAPGTIRESIDSDVAKPMLAKVVPMTRRSAGHGNSSGATLRPAVQLTGPFIRGSIKQQVLATIGAVAGLFGGGYLGMKIEGNRCHCDDPGLAGGLIGASIGGIVGGVVGFKLGK